MKFRRDSRKRVSEAQPEEDTSSEDSLRALTMVHMQGPLYLYLVCTFVSFAAFLSEMIARGCHFGHHMKRCFPSCSQYHCSGGTIKVSQIPLGP